MTVTAELFGGLDIGGTKCAAVIGRPEGDSVTIIGKRSFPTPPEPEQALADLMAALDGLLAEYGESSAVSGRGKGDFAGNRDHAGKLSAIGVSCGGPLDSALGLVLSPPNLPGWDNIDVLTPLRQRYGVPTALQNDANACALAEWRWGAGRGTRNMIFLTFGTGMGAGLILNGELYTGASGMAGEIGHVRMAENGPIGYGKPGSFEGFCSGGGIARQAREMARTWLSEGKRTQLAVAADLESLEAITARAVGEAAQAGDELAVRIMEQVGVQLGRGLALLVDVLNPDCIVIGSIYARQEALLAPVALRVLRQEALVSSLAACRIVSAGLGENVGDAAGLSVAWYAWEADRRQKDKALQRDG